MKKKNELELVHPDRDGFKECVTPKKDTKGLFFFECSKCKGKHFRHAGYMKAMMPFLRANGEKKVSVDDYQVWVCVKCRSAYIWLGEQMYDVTSQIDIEAWQKFEKEAHKATGPGGNC